MNLANKIESILFFKGEPVPIKLLAKLLEVNRKELEEGLLILENRLKEAGGIRLIKTDKEAQLVTSPECFPLIKELIKEELERDLGKAGNETLAIVLYASPLTRLEVDYIRGVNSTYMLRHLSIRGLIERTTNQKDKRGFVYSPTLKLLSYLGVTKTKELPEYDLIREELKAFQESLEEQS